MIGCRFLLLSFGGSTRQIRSKISIVPWDRFLESLLIRECIKKQQKRQWKDSGKSVRMRLLL